MLFCWAVLGSLLLAPPTKSDDATTAGKQFDQLIAPLLAARCFDCHNATDRKGGFDLTRVESANKGGDSGAVIVPGNAADSLLWQRVRDGEMPPKKPLSAEEIERLKRWIDGGAKWGTSPIDPFTFTTSTRAGYDWWSLRPLRRPELPPVVPEFAKSNPHGADHPIDRFVWKRLADEGLSPSPQADARTLIRRLSFDLLGLPPSPDEVAAFEADVAKTAAKMAAKMDLTPFSAAVDRLLASPHFGERWARHWLDIIRFGESQGFERDKLRTNSWRFRDWVVNAFNRDMPYDEFVRMQLAGDVLQPDDPNAVIATGCLVAGAYDEVGQSQQSAAMRAVVRQDEFEDIVSTVGETFLGLTVHCARCHDHKFDPVLQRDYYRMSAALAGVRHGERELPAGGEQRATGSGQAKAMQLELLALQTRLTAIEADARQAILAERQAPFDQKQKLAPPKPIARWEFNDDLKDSLGELHGTAHNGAKLDDGALRLDGQRAFVATAPLKSPLKAKTLEVWARLENLKQQGGGAISVQALDGATFDAIVFGEREPAHWMAGSNGYARTQSFQAPAETDADRAVVQFTIVYDADGTITGYRNGLIYGQPYKSNGPVTFDAEKSQIVFGLRHAPVGGNRHLAAWIDKAQLYDRALTADEVAASTGTVTDFIAEPELLARLSDEAKSERSRLMFETDHLRKQLVRAHEPKVYAILPRAPEATHLLLRGNPGSPAEEVTAGGISAFAKLPQTEERLADFSLSKDASDADRRQAFAAWITDRRNPLFARVIVNRLWHYHFGVGLVDSPSDFGFNGGRPSHPELLDWLAAELMDHDWSLKHIHKLIVTSATYRQSSRPRVDAARQDAGNRLLWRKSPLRLDAETVRDAVLAVTGELNPVVGGLGYHDFTTFTFNSQFYEIVDPIGRSFQRRSLYRTWVRSGRNPFLEVLDCPDPSTKTPRRAVTTTPLQALALLNNSFMLRMSERLAERSEREAGREIVPQIDRVYRLTLGRGPTDDERQLAREFVSAHRLPAFCRVLFNSNEFLYVE